MRCLSDREKTVCVCFTDLLVMEAGVVLWLENRSTAALWLLALLADWVAGDTEGVCMLISFSRWSYTHTQTFLSPHFSDDKKSAKLQVFKPCLTACAVLLTDCGKESKYTVNYTAPVTLHWGAQYIHIIAGGKRLLNMNYKSISIDVCFIYNQMLEITEM